MAAGLFLWAAAGAPFPPSRGEDLEPRADAAARAAMAEESIASLALAVDVGGELLLAKGYGAAPLAAGPARATSVYRAGALADAFLATAIVQLATSGELDLEDPVAKHLPALESKPDVTVHHLLAHTSGLASYADFAAAQRAAGKDPGAAEIAAWIAAAPNDSAPGSCRERTDSNTLLLELLLQQATGAPVALALEQSVFAPAEMRDTGPCEGTQGSSGPRETDGSVVELDGDSARLEAVELCSTVLDVVAWQRALVERAIVGDEGYDLILREIRIADQWPSGATYAFERVHLGELEGFAAGRGRAHVAYYPGADLTIALFADAEEARLDLLERRLARAALALPDPDVAEQPLARADQARYTGSYYVGCTEYSIVRGPARLVVHPPVGAPFELLYRGGHRFTSADDPDVQLEFVMGDRRAEAMYLELHGSRIRAQRM